MNGSKKGISELLDLNRVRLVIPIYQRNYDWGKDNCKRLFDDIINQINDKCHHFIGSIIYKSDSSGRKWSIIDGQQRVITIILIYKALYDLAQEGKIKFSDKISIDEVGQILKMNTGDTRLKPGRKDEAAFLSLFDSQKTRTQGSKILVNYNLFRELIERSKLSVEDLADRVNRLEIILINLEEADNAQLIFEALNSTGLKLKASDNIRNFLLMSLDSIKEQERLYEQYWGDIEECDAENPRDPSDFIRNYLTVRTHKIISKESIYEGFKDYCGDRDKETLLKDILLYARIYRQIQGDSTGCDALDRQLQNLYHLNQTVHYPFLMSLLAAYHDNDKEMPLAQVLDILQVIESYIVRIIICQHKTNGLNRFLSTLWPECVRVSERSNATICEALKWILLQKDETTVNFPKDLEVREALRTLDVYHKLHRDNRNYLLDRLNNNNRTKELVDVFECLENKEASIEHIMPQELTDAWRKELGPNFKRVHKQWLNNIANLTITGYNQELSNRAFREKVDGFTTVKGDRVYGLGESKFLLNKSVVKHEKWSEEALNERLSELTNEFLKLLPSISSNLKCNVELSPDLVPLSDVDFIPTNQKLKAYVFRGDKQRVKSWVDMFLQVCQILCGEDEDKFDALCRDKTHKFVAVPPDDKKIYYSQIGPNCWVWAQIDNANKLNVLRSVFRVCDVDCDQLQFELGGKDDSKKS